jgi:hypothetical protein
MASLTAAATESAPQPSMLARLTAVSLMVSVTVESPVAPALMASLEISSTGTDHLPRS